MSRTGAPRALSLALAAAGWLSASGAWAAGPPVVAVFGIQSDVPTLKAKELDGFTDYLATRMAEGGRYKVVPKTELKRALQQKKAESYDACYAESCQIEIGNEVAAQQTLSSRLQRFGDTCVLTLTLYDLRQATSAGAATAEGACRSGDIFKMLKTAASKLAGSASAAAPGVVTNDPPSGTDYSAILAEAERAEKAQEPASISVGPLPARGLRRPPHHAEVSPRCTQARSA